MDKYTLDKNTFSYWMRENLKDAYSGLITQDFDFVFINNKEKYFLVIEEKNSKNARLGPAQKIIFKMLNDMFYNNANMEYKFHGVIVLYILNKNISPSNIKEMVKDKIKNYDLNYFELENDVLDKLWDCKQNPPYRKTEKERSFYRGSYINDIFKNVNLPEYIFCYKIDWIFLNYCTGFFILIEEENKNKKTEKRKEKFIAIVDKIFNGNINDSYNPKSKVKYKYLGYYRLKFSGESPYDSESIYLNNRKIELKKLVNLLNLDSDEIKSYL